MSDDFDISGGASSYNRSSVDRVRGYERIIDEDPDAPADGKVLVAGGLYDAETGEEIDDGDPCEHEHASEDDDGLGRRFFVCDECDEEVVLSLPDEDGRVVWELVG